MNHYDWVSYKEKFGWRCAGTQQEFHPDYSDADQSHRTIGAYNNPFQEFVR